MTDPETAAAEALPTDPVTTRNKLLRTMRRLVEIKAGQRFIHSIPADAVASRVQRPASYFLGVDVTTDIEHLANEIEDSVDELAGILRETPADQPGPQ